MRFTNRNLLLALCSFFAMSALAFAEHVIVRFAETPSTARRQTLEADGLRLLEALGGNEYVARLVPGKDAKAYARRLDLGLRAMTVEDKLATTLGAAVLPAHALSERGGVTLVDVNVRYHIDVAREEAVSAVVAEGGSVLRSAPSFSRLTARIPADRLRSLAKQESVAFVDAVAGPPEEHTNARSGEMLRIGELHAQPLNLLGEGMRVGLWDGGLVGTHPQFDDRVRVVDDSFVSSHATHVAGTIAASGNGDARLRGMAPRVTLFSYDFYDDVTEEMARAVTDKGIILAHNSWGLGIDESYGNCNDYGRYATEEREMDQLVSLNRLSIVFSAGNDRDADQCVIQPRAGFYTIARPASAKNVITVGAVDTEGAVSAFSGYGPTIDGRLKPDLMALGVQVLSTAPNGAARTASGTSMSAPAVSGLLALLHSRVQAGSPGSPNPALLKALLLNTAKDLGNPGPDYTFGYGIPDGVNAVSAIDEKRFGEGSLTTGASREHTIEVPSGAEALRVTLAWMDAPGPTNGRAALVNDLDVVAVAPDGTRVLPLTLDPANPWANAKPDVNRRDNVEQVVVTSPAAGSWKVEVRGHSVASPWQEYALVWSFDRLPAPPCTTTVTPMALELREAASTQVVAVTRASQCSAFTPRSNVSWLTVEEKESSGTSVLKLRVAANDSGSRRRGEITIADRTVSVVQTPSCKSAVITPGEKVESSLNASDCYYEDSYSFAKMFTFEAKAGQLVSIEMRSAVVDTLVGLLSPAGRVLAANDDSGDSSNSRIPANEGEVVLPVTGTYTIVATTYDEDDAGPFELLLTLTDPPAIDGTAPVVVPLEGCPASQEAELGERSSRLGRRGSLFYTDAYEFPGRVGQRVVVDIPEAAFDTFLYLIGPSGESIAMNDDQPESSRSQITAVLPVTGQFRLEVSAFSPFTGGRYKLAVQGCSATPAQ